MIARGGPWCNAPGQHSTFRRHVSHGLVAIVAACLLFTVPLFSAAAASSGPNLRKDPVQIGVVVAESGPLANVDGPYLQGLEIGANLVNAAGGADGRRIELHVLDGQSSPTTGGADAVSLLGAYPLSAIISGSSATTSAELAELGQAHAVPILTDSLLPSQNSPWLYQVAASVQQLLASGENFMANHLHVKRVALLWPETPLGAIVSAYFPQEASHLGMSVVASLPVPTDATNFETQLAQIKAANPQALYNYNVGSGEILAAEAAQEVGMTATLFQDSLPEPAVSSVALYTGGPTYFGVGPDQALSHLVNTTEKSLGKRCVSAFERAGGALSNVDTACYGVDAIRLVAALISSAHGATSGTKLNSVITNNFHFQGSGGSYTWTKNDHTGVVHEPNPYLVGELTPLGSIKIVYQLAATKGKK